MGRGLSQLQRAILELLPLGPEQGRGDYIGHLPTSGAILDALGRPRDNAGYAAVSKALARLEQRGLVISYRAQVALRGKALRYARADQV